MTTTTVSQETREAEVTQDDIGWATSAAQHLCSPQDSDAAIRLLAQAFARHRHQAERDTLARMEPVAFTALVGTRRERRRIESVNELMRLINGGSFISEIRRASTLPPAPEAGQ